MVRRSYADMMTTGRCLYSKQSQAICMSTDSVMDAKFVFLQLLDARGRLLSRNVYWLPCEDAGAQGLRALRQWAACCHVQLQVWQ